MRPPVDVLCELLPRLQCRYYSISSSPRQHSDRIHITAVLVRYTTRTGRMRQGVATGYLAGLCASGDAADGGGSRVPLFVRHSNFRLPTDPSRPIIMVGPGTGLAPFRGFLQERHYYAQIRRIPVGGAVLFFGCRYRLQDFIYEAELQQLRDVGTLSQLHVAFSRDQPHKVYVTHLLEQQADDVYDLLCRRNGHLYVCG